MASTTKMCTLKPVSTPSTRPRPLSLSVPSTRASRIICEAKPTDTLTAALVTATPTLLLATPAMAKVGKAMESEGTGLILGITDPVLGFAMLVVFGIVWALYAVAAKDLGGGEGEDSGLSL